MGKDEVILYIVFSSILDALYRVFSNCSPLRVLSFGFHSKSHKSVEISLSTCTKTSKDFVLNKIPKGKYLGDWKVLQMVEQTDHWPRGMGIWWQKSVENLYQIILSCNIERYLLRWTNGTLYCGFGWRRRELGQFPSLETWRWDLTWWFAFCNRDRQ